MTGVVFEDGSTDGQAVSVFRLRENWMGSRDYFSQLLPCFHRLPSTLVAQDEAALADCETEAGKQSAKGKSADYQDGFQNAQRESANQLREIRRKIHSGDFSAAANQRDRIVKLLAKFQRR